MILTPGPWWQVSELILISRNNREALLSYSIHNHKLFHLNVAMFKVLVPRPSIDNAFRRQRSIFRTLASYATLYYDGPTSVSVIGSRVPPDIRLDPVLLKKSLDCGVII